MNSKTKLLKGKILDKLVEEKATCTLIKVSLLNYINSVPEKFKDYAIQRGIVPNKFLDDLIETVIHKAHIPPIVLIGKGTEDDDYLLVEEYRILDGLQRTNKLLSVYKALQFVKKYITSKDELTNFNAFVRNNKNEIIEIGANTGSLNRAYEYLKANKDFEHLFMENFIWIEVWEGLPEQEEINKMLILNAGHKSVNIKHQVELLFLPLYENLKAKFRNIKIYREKEISAMAYSKNRKPREFFFAHIISALVSLYLGKAVNTNADFIQKMKSDQLGEFSDIDKAFSHYDLEAFFNFLTQLDHSLLKKYKDVGIKWLGREVSLVGLFAAIGSSAEEKKCPPFDFIQSQIAKIEGLIAYLNLEEYEKTRNNVSLSKVNIGNVNKKAIFTATCNFLSGKESTIANWEKFFGEQNGNF